MDDKKRSILIMRGRVLYAGGYLLGWSVVAILCLVLFFALKTLEATHEAPINAWDHQHFNRAMHLRDQAECNQVIDDSLREECRSLLRAGL